MVLLYYESIGLFCSFVFYINVYWGKIFVIMFGGEVIEDDNFVNIIQDIVLFNSLGVCLVLVYGVCL